LYGDGVAFVRVTLQCDRVGILHAIADRGRHIERGSVRHLSERNHRLHGRPGVGRGGSDLEELSNDRRAVPFDE
jgi:hypothetical protein